MTNGPSKPRQHVPPRAKRRKGKKSPPWLLKVAIPLIVAAIGALGMDVPTLTAVNKGPPAAAASPPRPEFSPALTVSYYIAITSTSQYWSPQLSGEVYSFQGTVSDWPTLNTYGAQISVIGILNTPLSPLSPRPWIVSPPAQIHRTGQWVVRLKLSNPLSRITWKAIIVFQDMRSPSTSRSALAW